jgi:hypothetical protein
MDYMCRSYGTLKKGCFLHPWIEIHGYNIDRLYETSASKKDVSNGKDFNPLES